MTGMRQSACCRKRVRHAFEGRLALFHGTGVVQPLGDSRDSSTSASTRVDLQAGHVPKTARIVRAFMPCRWSLLLGASF